MNILTQVMERVQQLKNEDTTGIRHGPDGDPVCYYCGKSLDRGYHIDHVNPHSKWGNNRKNNYVLACKSCNERKSAKLPLVWLSEIESMPDEPAVDLLARILLGQLQYAYLHYIELDKNESIDCPPPNYEQNLKGAFIPLGIDKEQVYRKCPHCGGDHALMTVTNHVKVILHCQNEDCRLTDIYDAELARAPG